jgi:ribose-phosphate pyrophosphokinase
MLRLQDVNGQMNTVFCSKKRDPLTGHLSGFEIKNYNPNPNADGQDLLIVDDICDGGGTFVGLAKELRKAGAKKVYLYVTHGIFSKGLPLEGIDRVFTTDSYSNDWDVKNSEHSPFKNSSTIPMSMFGVRIPISMKELP